MAEVKREKAWAKLPRVLIPVQRLKVSLEEDIIDLWEIEVRVVLKKEMKTYKGVKMF